MDVSAIEPKDFIIRSEDYGLPQARHRVILLGVRSDLALKATVGKLHKAQQTHVVDDVLNGLPSLRSKLSRETDTPEGWAQTVIAHLKSLAKDAAQKGQLDLCNALLDSGMGIRHDLPTGGVRYRGGVDRDLPSDLRKWYLDPNLNVWLNHESRSHMSSDLRRYAYAATFANLYGHSPKGHEQFELEGLRPNHENWESGKFSDRFRVQRYGSHSNTVTSHIAKDGHYFIHPDPTQCRSLTVREAARLQTFPDNYFFMGNRTQQFHQVGNAVPPLLASQIAEIVKKIIK